ncbi:hypothetical protein DMENIID0001_069330 [Sergentomyia squamirostris]
MFLKIPFSISGIYLQCLCTILMSSSNLAGGIFSSWPSQTLPLLLSSDSPLASGPITQLEASYMVSISYAGGVIGSLAIGYVPTKYGRKMPFIVTSLISLLSCLLIVFATNVYCILVSRFLCGISGGTSRVILPTYICEICEKKFRGAFGLLSLIFFSLGVSLGSIICEYLNFYTVPYVPLTFYLLSLLLILFPDSPQTLMLQKNLELAEKSIRFYRRNVSEEKILEEFREMKQSIDNSGETVTLQDFQSRAVVKALIIVTILVSTRNFSGINTIGAYSGIILSQIKVSVDLNEIISWFFTIQLFGSVATTFAVDTIGRRFTLMTGLVGNTLFLTIFGSCFYSQGGLDDWILIASFLGISTTGIVLINMPAVIYPEILPVKLRNAVGSILITLQLLEGLFLVQFYIPASNAFGTHSCMFAFAAWNVLALIVMWIMLPETKKKSTDEILEKLDKKIIPCCSK